MLDKGIALWTVVALAAGHLRAAAAGAPPPLEQTSEGVRVAGEDRARNRTTRYALFRR